MAKSNQTTQKVASRVQSAEAKQNGGKVSPKGPAARMTKVAHKQGK